MALADEMELYNFLFRLRIKGHAIMAVRARPSPIRPASPSARTKAKPETPTHERDGFIREAIWDIFSISNHLNDVRRAWASMLEVSGPQWLILMAIDHLDAGDGVSVGTVSAKLHVNQTFIVAQSKLLEAEGFVHRRASKEDARVVLLSLTETTRRKLQRVVPRRNETNDFIFSDLNDRALRDFSAAVASIRTRIESAAVMLNLERKKQGGQS